MQRIKRMKKNKILLILGLCFLVFTTSIFSNEMDTEEFEMAKVNRSTIDLYMEPNINSEKELGKFQYGNMLKIYFCNKQNWCKTDGGFVKQYLLQFQTLKETLKENGVISVLNPTQRLKTKWNNAKLFFRTSVDERVTDILSAIALQNKSQIIFDKGIEETETLTIEDMPLEGAFNLIIERNNLEYKWQGNTLIVSSVKNREIKKEFIILKNLTIDKLIVLLKRYNIYTKIKNKVIFDNEMNAVYVEAEQEVIKDLQKILMQFETAEKLLRETRVKRTKEEIEYRKLEYLAKKDEALKEKKKKYGIHEYDDWKMQIEIIPLKYISVSSKEVEFMGKSIKVDSLEDTLKGLLGTGYVNKNTDKNRNEDNRTRITSENTDIKVETTYLKIDARTNSVIIKDFPDRIEEIKEIIAKLDTPAKLVEIEVTIASGSTGFTSQLGMALGGARTEGSRTYGLSTAQSTASVVNSRLADEKVTLLEPAGALGLSGSMLYSGSRSIISAQLNAMENEGIGKVLSNPKLVTLDNREATIHSGNTISFPIATDGEIGLETVDAGIAIRTTPHIIEVKGNVDKDIMLDINIESSSLGDTTGSQVNKTTNNINSSVIMKNGQTLILGGLFQYTKSNNDGGVPLLKDIPILGFFFSTENELLNKSELVFFITPKIITQQRLSQMQNANSTYYTKDLVNQKKIFAKKQNEDTQDDLEEFEDDGVESLMAD
jgi:type II secretory pathway component GspD/PulD (secretin)